MQVSISVSNYQAHISSNGIFLGAKKLRVTIYLPTKVKPHTLYCFENEDHSGTFEATFKILRCFLIFGKFYYSTSESDITRYVVMLRENVFPFGHFSFKWSFTEDFSLFGLTKQAHNGWFYFSNATLAFEI